MVFLDFEKPLEVLYEQLDKLKEIGGDGEIDVTDTIRTLARKLAKRWVS